MTSFSRMLRQTMIVVRRDFTATVLTPTFLIFLLAPVFMIGFGAIGGIGAHSLNESSVEKMRMVVIAPPSQAPMLREVDTQLRKLFPKSSELTPPQLTIEAPQGNPAAQARALFESEDFEAAAVLFGSLDKPEILHAPRGWTEARYLAQLADQALRSQRAGSAAPLSTPTLTRVTRSESSLSGQGQAASLGVFGVFFLTLFLAGQVVGSLAEERSNKVIEILAAAIPLESVFLGKLVAMFAVAVVFIAFWATLLINAIKLLPPDIARAFSEIGAAVGPAYPLLFVAYFTTAYFLLGAVFLSVGAQTSTQRELQMLSLPITIFQMVMFGVSLAASADPHSWFAFAAQVFPFSSPFAMIGRAGNSPELWPHFAALAWQGLWVAIMVTLGARWFRRGVLKSGSAKLSLRALFSRAGNIDTNVN